MASVRESDGGQCAGGGQRQKGHSHNHLLATQERVADELAGAQSHGRVVVRHGEGRLSSGRWEVVERETVVVVMQSINGHCKKIRVPGPTLTGWNFGVCAGGWGARDTNSEVGLGETLKRASPLASGHLCRG